MNGVPTRVSRRSLRCSHQDIVWGIKWCHEEILTLDASTYRSPTNPRCGVHTTRRHTGLIIARYSPNCLRSIGDTALFTSFMTSIGFPYRKFQFGSSTALVRLARPKREVAIGTSSDPGIQLYYALVRKEGDRVEGLLFDKTGLRKLTSTPITTTAPANP